MDLQTAKELADQPDGHPIDKLHEAFCRLLATKARNMRAEPRTRQRYERRINTLCKCLGLTTRY